MICGQGSEEFADAATHVHRQRSYRSLRLSAPGCHAIAGAMSFHFSDEHFQPPLTLLRLQGAGKGTHVDVDDGW